MRQRARAKMTVRKKHRIASPFPLCSGSGSMEFPTFLSLVPKLRHHGDSEEEIDEAFRVFDKAYNEKISAAELR